MTGDLVWLDNGTITAQIADLGAELQSLCLPGVGEYLWQGDPAHWAERAPILFPITGRAAGGRVASGGIEADMPIHGFARSLRFARKHSDAQNCTHVLQANDETRRTYPHDFALTVTHRLLGGALQIAVLVENRDTAGDMPFALGLHPGFSWPLPGALGLPHDLILPPGARPRRAALYHGFLAGGAAPALFKAGRLPLTEALFAADDSLVYSDGVQGAICYRAANGASVALRWRGFDHLVLWHPPGAGFLCIEPWQGLPPSADGPPDIALRPGAVTLPPGGQRRFDLWITPSAPNAPGFTRKDGLLRPRSGL